MNQETSQVLMLWVEVASKLADERATAEQAQRTADKLLMEEHALRKDLFNRTGPAKGMMVFRPKGLPPGEAILATFGGGTVTLSLVPYEES